MTLSDTQKIFAQNVALLIQEINKRGYSCTLGEVYRTEEQAKINQKKGIGILDSLHRDRLAIDLNLFSPTGVYLTDSRYYEPFGLWWESIHPQNQWGGKWKIKDGNHFQMNKN